MAPPEPVVEVVGLSEDQYANLLEAREAMYGDDASEIDLSHVISLLAKQETARAETPPQSLNQETPR